MSTNFSGSVYIDGANIAGLGKLWGLGNHYFVDYRAGADGFEGTYDRPFKTLAQAYAKCQSGHDDVVFIKSYDGGLSAAVRIPAGGMTWAKDNCHLVGLCAPIRAFRRATIRPASDDVTTTTLFTLSADNCVFANLSFYIGHAGDFAQITFVASGQRCYFEEVEFVAPGHATPGGKTGTRALKIAPATGGEGEHTFRRCIIGGDTADASVQLNLVELTSGTPRNVFEDCLFRIRATAATPKFVLIGVGGIDRDLLFKGCLFSNAVGAGATTITNSMNVDAAAGGDVVLWGCEFKGVSEQHAGTPTNIWATPVYNGTNMTEATGVMINPT